MNFNIDVRLTTLRCVQPEESEEEPYLWLFFFKLDGSTVTQLTPNLFRLVGKIHITSGDGQHRNLSQATTTEGQILDIPAGTGAYSATLRPISLQVLGQTVLVPGKIIAFGVLMEEDATPDGAIVKAHAALRDFLELSWNDFIANGLTEEAVTKEASELLRATPTLSPREAYLAAVQRLLERFVDSLGEQGEQVVQDTILFDAGLGLFGADAFDLIANAVDHDDSLGSFKLTFDERQIVDAGFSVPIHVPIQQTDDGATVAYHEVDGYLHATLRPGTGDVSAQTALLSTATLDGGEHVLRGPLVCIPPETRVVWTLSARSYVEEFRFRYPFLGVRWRIADRNLVESEGTVELDLACSFPRFDPSRVPNLTSFEHVQKRVHVRYEVKDEGDDGKVLRLWNDPNDGRYSLIVSAVGLAGHGAEIPLDTAMVTFSGQTIDLGPPNFLSAYRQCRDELDRRFAKSRKRNVKGPVDPHSRFELAGDLVRLVDDVVAQGRLASGRAPALKAAIAKKLRVKLGS